MNEQLSIRRQQRILNACSQQVQSLTELARACAHEDQPLLLQPCPKKGIVTPPLTEDQVDALVALYRHGLSLRQIAARAKRSRMTVLRYLHDRGVEMRPRTTRRLNQDQVRMLASRYERGESVNLLARQLDVAVTTALRYLKGQGVTIRGQDRSSSSLNEEVFRRRDSPQVQHWLGYLSSSRCEVSEPGDDAWFRVRFPFKHEDKLKDLRSLLMAPEDTKRCRQWQNLDSVVLRVQSASLVEQLEVVGIVSDPAQRVCKVRDLFFSRSYWAGLLDAVAIVEEDKLSVKAGPLLSVQFVQFVRTVVPQASGRIDGDWVIFSGELVKDIVEAIYGPGARCQAALLDEEPVEEQPGSADVVGQLVGVS